MDITLFANVMSPLKTTLCWQVHEHRHFHKPTDKILLNFTHYGMLYAQNGNCIVATDTVTSLHAMYTDHNFSKQTSQMTAYITTGWAKKVVQSSSQLIDDATVQDKTKQAVSRKTCKPAEAKRSKKTMPHLGGHGVRMLDRWAHDWQLYWC